MTDLPVRLDEIKKRWNLSDAEIAFVLKTTPATLRRLQRGHTPANTLSRRIATLEQATSPPCAVPAQAFQRQHHRGSPGYLDRFCIETDTPNTVIAPLLGVSPTTIKNWREGRHPMPPWAEQAIVLIGKTYQDTQTLVTAAYLRPDRGAGQAAESPPAAPAPSQDTTEPAASQAVLGPRQALVWGLWGGLIAGGAAWGVANLLSVWWR